VDSQQILEKGSIDKKLTLIVSLILEQVKSVPELCLHLLFESVYQISEGQFIMHVKIDLKVHSTSEVEQVLITGV